MPQGGGPRPTDEDLCNPMAAWNESTLPSSAATVRARKSRWLPFYEPLSRSTDVYVNMPGGGGPLAVHKLQSPSFTTPDAARYRELMQLTDVDARRMRCRATMRTPGGTDKVLRLRFTEADVMEEFLTISPVVNGSRHHRCSCCLEWVHADGMRCVQCQQPLHRRCAEKWLRKSNCCPFCRADWHLKPKVESRS